MSKKAAERCALAAVIALIIYSLACFYPAAWSPDSSRVIFPVFRKIKEGEIARLVMTDNQGKVIREVARVENESDLLSPAAWSPDGKWIAYMKLVRTKVVVGDDKGEFEYLFSLVLQAAESGKEQIIRRATVREDKNDVWAGNFMYGAQWAGDSRGLAVMRMNKENPGLLMLDLNGKVQSEIPLAGEATLQTIAVSPDGTCLAYLKELEQDGADKQYALCLQSRSDGKTREIARFLDPDSSVPPCPPVWAADSQTVFFVVLRKDKDEKTTSMLKRYELKSGQVETVWQEERLWVTGISLARDADTLAVSFMKDKKGDSVCGIYVMNTKGRELTALHYANELFWATSMSPDGRWVAFCPVVEFEGKEWSLGAIVSSDGSELKFFLPDQKMAKQIPQLLGDRLAATLKALGLEKQANSSPELLTKLMPLLDKLANESHAPVIKEATAFGKAYFWAEAIADTPLAQREAMAGEARKHLAAFSAAYPGHAVIPLLEEQIAEALRAEPEKKAE